MPIDIRGSTAWEQPVEIDFRGLGCDHAVLKRPEAKNLPKTAKHYENQSILIGFCLLVALQTPKINFWGLSPIFRSLLGPSRCGASENIAILNICFNFSVVKAPSSDNCSQSKITPPVHFISFKVKCYVISWLLVKRP